MGNLEQIKAGDSVTILNARTVVEIMQVVRVTKTQVITCRSESNVETRWKKSTGRKVGEHSRWSYVDIFPTTEEHRVALKRGYLLSRVIGLCEIPNLRKLDIEQLEQIVEVFKKEEQGEING